MFGVYVVVDYVVVEFGVFGFGCEWWEYFIDVEFFVVLLVGMGVEEVGVVLLVWWVDLV